MKIPPCPHCGKDTWVYINGQWRGPAVSYYNENGEHEETNADKLYSVYKSNVVRCSDCKHIRRDLVFINGQIKLIN